MGPMRLRSVPIYKVDMRITFTQSDPTSNRVCDRKCFGLSRFLT